MKSSVKKVFTVLILAVVLVASLAAQSIYEKQPLFGKTVILHSNDVHGALEGYSYLPVLREKFEKQGAKVIIVDAGDFTNGNVYVSYSKGLSAVSMMNAAGYDVVTLGNHEFDFGIDQLKSNLAQGKFEVVNDNLLKDGEYLFDTSVSYSSFGNSILFVGIETPETQTKVNPGLIQGIQFLDKEDLWKVTQTVIDTGKAAGQADIVVVLAHLGIANESKGRRSYELYDNVKGIDFIIDAHSHTMMSTPANITSSVDPYTVEPGKEDYPIQSTGTQFASVGVIVINNLTKSIEDFYVIPTEGLEQDPDVLALAKGFISEVDEKYGAQFAVTEVEMLAKNKEARFGEINLGDLICDAMVWKIVSENPDIDASKVVGITNGGGIRADLHVGPISMKDILSVLPFGNTLAVVYATGTELLEVLEASTFSSPGSIGAFPQVAGINFTIDTTKEYDQGEAYPGSTYYGPKSIRRVTINSINGQPFDPEATYTIISNNFLTAGGDTYYAFKAAFDAGKAFDASIPLDQVVAEYIEKVLGGVIGQEYAEPQGRITMIK